MFENKKLGAKAPSQFSICLDLNSENEQEFVIPEQITKVKRDNE